MSEGTYPTLEAAVIAALDDVRGSEDGAVIVHAEWCVNDDRWETGGTAYGSEGEAVMRCNCKPLRLDPAHILTADDVARVLSLHAEMWRQ